MQTFANCSGQWLLCSVQFPHCGGFSCCRAWILKHGLNDWHMSLVPPWHVESSWTRNQICVPSIGRWILNHTGPSGKSFPLVFLKDYFFRGVLRFIAKLIGRHIDIPYTPSPTHAQPPQLSISPPDGTFVITDEPTLTHHNHSKFIVYIMVHHWC